MAYAICGVVGVRLERRAENGSAADPRNAIHGPRTLRRRLDGPCASDNAKRVRGVRPVRTQDAWREGTMKRRTLVAALVALTGSACAAHSADGPRVGSDDPFEITVQNETGSS